MAFDPSGSQIVFIIACPRSGTTILAQVLASSDRLAHLYDPYYLWDWFHHDDIDDLRDENDADFKTINFLRREYQLFFKNQFGANGDGYIIDQGPEKAFRIGLLQKVFPNARYIYLIRDGRAVTQSIETEWGKRKQFIENRNFRDFLAVVTETISYQPTLRLKMFAVLHEIRSKFRSLNPKVLFSAASLMNKSKWRGLIGWGPRFRGWQNKYEQIPAKAFHALQWCESNREIIKFWPQIGKSEKGLKIRFEDLITHPDETLDKVWSFLKVTPVDDFADKFDRDVLDKWRNRYSKEDITLIEDTIGPMLGELGYNDEHIG